MKSTTIEDGFAIGQDGETIFIAEPRGLEIRLQSPHPDLYDRFVARVQATTIDGTLITDLNHLRWMGYYKWFLLPTGQRVMDTKGARSHRKLNRQFGLYYPKKYINLGKYGKGANVMQTRIGVDGFEYHQPGNHQLVLLMITNSRSYIELIKNIRLYW
ncbi:hypothetical protein HY491_03400 [Candidatus Woesearchaeota archaeon]|nr:hypothetical protein [Candidatus Woesearchaeota archaeon]